jgi:hypothetical protein
MDGVAVEAGKVSSLQMERHCCGRLKPNAEQRVEQARKRNMDQRPEKAVKWKTSQDQQREVIRVVKQAFSWK